MTSSLSASKEEKITILRKWEPIQSKFWSLKERGNCRAGKSDVKPGDWVSIAPKCSRRFSFSGTKYITAQLRNETRITRYDHANNFVRLQVNQDEPENLFYKCVDDICGFHTNQIWSPVFNLTISNEYDFTDISIQINVFEVKCTFYNKTELAWSKSGVVSGDQVIIMQH